MRPHAIWVTVLTLGTTGLMGCAVNAATGERQLITMSKSREIALGREADPAITASMGLYDDAAIQAYVSGIGQQMAALSEEPELPWTFKVVDDPIVNAFALPGGFIYITRGILAHFDSEAQLAAVVGHEIGHVTGRHSAEQMSRAQLLQVGLVAGMVLGPESMHGVFGAAGAGMGLLFLKFGRDDERQADELGLRYMSRAGYDAREMPGVFAMLGRVSAAGGGGRTPEWLSSHPNPEDREQRIAAALAEQPTQGTVGRDAFLDRIDGLVYGPDPRQGYFDGARFLHPDLRFTLDFPAGWQTQNQRQAVVAVNEHENALMQLTVTDASDVDAAVATFLAEDAITGGPATSRRINGLSARTVAFSATTRDGAIPGAAWFVAYDNRVYRILGYGETAAWSNERSSVADAATSFRPLTDPAALNVRPLRLDIVRLPEAMTVAEFAARYPSDVEATGVALLNQRELDETVPAGTRLKRVVRP